MIKDNYEIGEKIYVQLNLASETKTEQVSLNVNVIRKTTNNDKTIEIGVDFLDANTNAIDIISKFILNEQK